MAAKVAKAKKANFILRAFQNSLIKIVMIRSLMYDIKTYAKPGALA